MLVLVIVLAATTVLACAALALLVLRPPTWLAERAGELDRSVATALDLTARRPATSGVTRRLICIEILNVRELAATRGRFAEIVGSLAPALVRRIVYDQTVRILKDQLVEQHVQADVRLLVLQPDDQEPV